MVMNANSALTIATAQSVKTACGASAPPVDDVTFEYWVAREYEAVFRFLVARTNHEDDARDLTQETFVKAYRARHRYQPDRPLRPWLLTIAANCQRDFLRRRRREATAIEPPTEETHESPSALALDLSLALPALTAEQRMVLHLRVVEQLSFKEIADVLRCSEAAAKMRLQRAKHQLVRLTGRSLIDAD